MEGETWVEILYYYSFFYFLFCVLLFYIFFFFSSRRRHTRWNCDWSSDVCSSDLAKDPKRIPLCHFAPTSFRRTSVSYASCRRRWPPTRRCRTTSSLISRLPVLRTWWSLTKPVTSAGIVSSRTSRARQPSMPIATRTATTLYLLDKALGGSRHPDDSSR